MLNVHIRGFRLNDMEAAFTLRQMPKAQRETLQLPYASFESFKQRYSSPDPNVHSLVAEVVESKKIVGALGLYRESNLRRAHTGVIGMAVHDDFHRQGIGSKLLAAALNLADNWLHLTRVELTVFIDNKPAIGLYKKFGFETEGQLRHYALRDGQLTDVFAMARIRV
jgi:putative acetyltransferase